MATLNLPVQDSPDLRLVEATDEELLAQQHAHFSQWGGVLSRDGYIGREKILHGHDLTKDGGLQAWVLVAQPEGASTRQVVCGCETIKKRALVSRNGEVEDVVAHVIGSVFCPPEFRRKGYAGRMMVELGKAMSTLQTDEAKENVFSVLYSDIGKQFYAARGWHPFESKHLSLPCTPPQTRGGLPPVRLLRAEDLAELCEVDEKLIRTRMAATKDSRPTLAMVPDQRTLGWHHAREEYVGQVLFGTRPQVKGAIAGEPGARVWCVWTSVWAKPQDDSPSTLHILRLAFEDASFADFEPASSEGVARVKDSGTVKAVAALLAAAQTESAQRQTEEVVLWNPTSTSWAAAQLVHAGARMEEREEESITSLRWQGEGEWRDVRWICNEKFGWA